MKLLKSAYFLMLSGVLLFSISPVLGQGADENLVKLADEMYGFGDKKDALAVYLQAVELNPDNVIANFMAGKCYLETVDKELSVTYLIKAYDLKKNIAPNIQYLIAQGYQLGSQFDNAIKYYDLYKQNLDDYKAKELKSSVKDEIIKTDRKIFECENGKNYLANPNHYKIENLGDVVNSEYPDYVPSITSDQSLMIFTSRRPGGTSKNKDVDNEYFEDIWLSRKGADGKWSAPQNLGPPINTVSHDANVGLSPDGKSIFIRKPENGGDIFYCEIKADGTWGEPKDIGGNINSKDDEPSVGVSADGKTIYFSSNKSGGFGGYDIYMSQKESNGKWGRAVNLGSKINTEYDEDAPFIDSDGKTLYFSSRGHKGMGGYDIYKAVYNKELKTWTEPENMGYPINSPDEDIYFVIAGDEETGYYASAKGDGYGDKDIYKIYLKPDAEPFVDKKKDSIAAPIVAKKDSSQPVAIKKDTTKKEPSIAKKDTTKKQNPVAVKKDSTIKKSEPVVSKKDTTLSPAPIAKTKKDTLATPPPIVAKSDTTAQSKEPAPVPIPVPVAVVEENESLVEKPKPTEKIKPTPKPKPIPVAKPVIALVPAIIKGRIYDQETGLPLVARITISNGFGNVIEVIDTKEDGTYQTQFSTKKPLKYSVNVVKDGYIYVNINLTIPANNKVQKTINRDFGLRTIEKDKIFILRNIYFEFGSHILKKESVTYLNNLSEWMRKNPGVKLEIRGHTDNMGTANFNKMLSLRRVNTVKMYLRGKGITGDRLSTIGYGEEVPLATNDDETEGREINRRTEFKIVEK
ncbi:MAG: OmpA family protein [Bacteroidota bacterium]|nr:OmpA family protein [Bacteroidota bacterium]